MFSSVNGDGLENTLSIFQKWNKAINILMCSVADYKETLLNFGGFFFTLGAWLMPLYFYLLRAFFTEIIKFTKSVYTLKMMGCLLFGH